MIYAVALTIRLNYDVSHGAFILRLPHQTGLLRIIPRVPRTSVGYSNGECTVPLCLKYAKAPLTWTIDTSKSVDQQCSFGSFSTMKLSVALHIHRCILRREAFLGEQNIKMLFSGTLLSKVLTRMRRVTSWHPCKDFIESEQKKYGSCSHCIFGFLT